MSGDDLAQLGRDVVSDGRLAQLQTRLQFSASQMSELVGVSIATYRRWMDHPRTILKPMIAHRVGTMYQRALITIANLARDKVDLDTLVPFQRAAARLGWPQEFLLARHWAGVVPGVDLGVLGTWMTLDTYNDMMLRRGSYVAA